MALPPAFLKGKKGVKAPVEKLEPKKGEKKEMKLSPAAQKKVEAKEAMTGVPAFKKGGAVKSKKC